MGEDRESTEGDRIRQAAAGDEQAMQRLFADNRPRLKRMVELRLDRRVQGRVDASDVLQEAYIDLVQQLPGYSKDPNMPFFLWMRRITGQRLSKIHRKHLGAAKRNAAIEVGLWDGGMPEASSFFLASKLIGQFTSAGAKAIRAERRLHLQGILNEMSAQDREILALKHIEQLENSEIAVDLETTESNVRVRYFRALRRLRSEVEKSPGMFD